MTVFSAIRRRWGSDRAIVAAQWNNLVYSWCIHNLKTNRFGQPHSKEKDGITFDKAPAEAIVIDGPQHGACEQPVFAHGNSRREDLRIEIRIPLIYVVSPLLTCLRYQLRI